MSLTAMCLHQQTITAIRTEYAHWMFFGRPDCRRMAYYYANNR